jgi:hypothetical protein
MSTGSPLLIFNGLIAGGCLGCVVGNSFGFGLVMTVVVALLGGAAGLGAAWCLQKYLG